jgi:predicted ATPase/DNA-binding CsgD family transcriptional regulator
VRVSARLPVHLSSFVGRDHELAEIRRLLERTRLVTLVGTGGCGKTRLAVEAARRGLSDGLSEAWFADLSDAQDRLSLLEAIAAAVDCPPTADQLDASLIRHMQNRRGLLVLDNCEHLVADAAATAHSLLQQSPDLQLLATSREPLRLEGEWTYWVPSLAVPDEHTQTRGALEAFDSVRLFLDRAASVSPSLELDDRNIAAVAGICRRLDGIPLALELAAGCAASLPLQTLMERLDHRFKLLVDSPRMALPRHRTLRAAFEWSEALLSEPERRLFRRLSVFVGGFSLAAAEAVVGDEHLPTTEILPLLRKLVARSLVVFSIDTGRYRMLETMRDFAGERLLEAGEVELLKDSHADYFAGLGRQLITARWHADPSLLGAGASELGNVRAALLYAQATGSARLAELATGMLPVIANPSSRDQVEEAERWLQLALDSQPADPMVSLSLLIGLGVVARHRGNLERARALLTQGLNVAEESGDAAGGAYMLVELGGVANRSGDYGGAIANLRMSTEQARALSDDVLLIHALTVLAYPLLATGEAAAALEAAQEAHSLALDGGDPSWISITRDTLSLSTLYAGDAVASLRWSREALAEAPGGWFAVLGTVATIAAGLIASGHLERGFRLVAAIETLSVELGVDPANFCQLQGPWFEQASKELGPRARRLRIQGGEMSLEQVRSYALEDPGQPPTVTRLTRRELEVANLVRDGLTNRKIAQMLFVAERTVEGHVENIRSKLGLTSRVQVATWVVENLSED